MAFTAVIALTACSGAEPETAPPVEVLSCPQSWRAAQTAVAGDASPPLCLRDTWVFDLPAESDAPSPRRSEVFLRTTGGSGGEGEVVGGEGDTVVFESEITAALGDSGAQDLAWHVLWQLQGPTGDEWRPPPIGLQVRNGTLSLGGGAGHPNHDWNSANHEWRVALGDFHDNVPLRVRVVVTLSADVDKAVVSAWFDGRRVLDNWRPRSADGHRPGTLYPGQAGVAARMGLYRGSQGERPPDYRQTVTQRLIEASAGPTPH